MRRAISQVTGFDQAAAPQREGLTFVEDVLANEVDLLV